MATLLENYKASKDSFENGLQVAKPGPAQIWMYQEFLYRIEVLEVCQMFVKTAPEGTDIKTLCVHYQMVDAYFQNLTMERRSGACSAESVQKQRDTAHGNLLRVIQDYRKRFGSFAPGNDADCYRKIIANVIQTVLPVWVQYRQTYIELTKEAA